MDRPVVLLHLCLIAACSDEPRKQPADDAPPPVSGAASASGPLSTAPAVAGHSSLVATPGATDPLLRPSPKVRNVPMEEAVLARGNAADIGEARVKFRPDGRKVAVVDEARAWLRVNDELVAGYERFSEHRWLEDGRLQFVAERGSPSAGGGSYVVTDKEVLGPYVSALAVGRGDDALIVKPQPGQDAVVAGGKLGPSFDKISVLDLAFGVERELVVYVGTRRDAEACVVTRAGEACFPGVKRPVVSADGSTVAFAAMDEDRKVRVVVGGKRGPAFDEIRAVALSRKASVWAYEAKKDGKAFVVVGDDQGERFDVVDHLRLSASGAAVAYYARNGNDAYLVAGSQRIPLPGSGTGPLGFGILSDLELSPDGGHFIGLTGFPGGGKHYAIVDGAAGPQFERVMFARMSFDGVAAYVVVDDRRQRMMIGETLGDPYDVVLPVEFGPTAGSFAYIARSAAQQFVVTDRGVFGPYRDVGLPDERPGREVGKIYFGVHGEVVCRVQTDQGWHLVIDGQLGPAFDQVFEPPTFTPGAIGYGVRKGDELRWAVQTRP